MNNNIGYIGIDPSIKHCGLSIIDTQLKQVRLLDFGVDDYNNKSTKSTFDAVHKIARKVRRNIVNQFDSITYIIGMEVPMAKGMYMDAEMYSLALYIYHMLRFDALDPVDLYSPSYLKFIQREFTPYKMVKKKNGDEEKKYEKYNKFYTQQFVTEVLIPIFLGFGYDVEFNLEPVPHPTEKDPNYKNRYKKYNLVSDGCADSLIYATREFIKYNKDSKLALNIIAHCPRFEENDKELK